MTYTKICVECSTEFTTSKDSVKICSDVCRHERKLTAQKKYRDSANFDRRKQNIRDRYNLTVEEYDNYFVSPSCGICGTEEGRMVLDHCHHSGEVRGVLCSLCNTGIGHLKDDINLLNKAIEWLSKERI